MTTNQMKGHVKCSPLLPKCINDNQSNERSLKCSPLSAEY